MTKDSAEVSTPTERQAALNIGSVDSVSPGRITVSLELDAPRTTALNTGSPVAFPRLNGFIVIPNEAGALVGIVNWLGIEHSGFPKRPGMKDFGLVDLPFPLRKMSVVPVGTLERASGADGHLFALRRGVVAFPSVGDPVALPSAAQLKALSRGEQNDERVVIGRTLLSNDAEVHVDPDKLFGRHLAVLGNTGSGKSCSVAGLIRWSIEAASAERKASKRTGPPNARFIVLDPSGEYSKAFKGLKGVQLFQVPPVEAQGARPLRVPAWLLNSHEWASMASASHRVQRPVLMDALRNLRTGQPVETGAEDRLSRLCRGQLALMESAKLTPRNYSSYPQQKGFGKMLGAFKDGLERYGDVEAGDDELQALVEEIDAVLDERKGYKKGEFEAFAEPDLDGIIERFQVLLAELPVSSEIPIGNEDLPMQFDVDLLAEHLDSVASLSEYEEAARYIGGLKLRVRSLVNDKRMRSILVPDDQPELEGWFEEFLGTGDGSSVAVIDLSLVPSDVVELVVAVMGRMIFEALQRYRRIHRKALPTVLVLEEAHAFVRSRPSGDEFPSAGEMCVRTFERISREGRKFGLGLVLASQRPSELSPTILAQCNSFLLHRLVNDRDQQLVGKLVPDNLAGLLEDLPSLPTRHALLIGWAAVLPTLLEIRELPKAQRPQSDDPDFWDVWIGAKGRSVDWKDIVSDWMAIGGDLSPTEE
jgi:DNA helicase HerA-like ATPase